jgi:frataxin-like iron-binding protein CyaY
MGNFDFTENKYTSIIDAVHKDIEKYLNEFKEKIDISYTFKTEITNYVFINIKAYKKDDVFIYQENLWCDYILEEKNKKKQREYIIDFVKSFLINSMNRNIFVAYKDILEA